MKYFILSFCLFGQFYTKAQDHTTLGDSLFVEIQNQKTDWGEWYITLDEYLSLVDRQSMTISQKEQFKSTVEESYTEKRKSFIISMDDVQDQYNYTDKDSRYSLDNISMEPVEGLKDIYYIRLHITFHWKKRKDPYILEFQAAKIKLRYVMMDAVQEYHQ